MSRERAPYDREHITDTYSKQDPILFMRNNWGKLQDDGSWIMERSLILRTNSPIVKDGKFIVNIKKVIGNFNCGGQELITLKGGPKEVGGHFWCGTNNLISLEYGPERVGGDYSMECNKIKDLKYVPRNINGEFDIGENPIETLEGGPISTKGNLILDKTNINNLIGCPEGIDELYIEDCNLKTLYGIKKCNGLQISGVNHNLSVIETAFAYNMIENGKVYKHYYTNLFKYCIDNFLEKVYDVKWPDGFLNEKRLGLINSMEVVNKFQL